MLAPILTYTDAFFQNQRKVPTMPRLTYGSTLQSSKTHGTLISSKSTSSLALCSQAKPHGVSSEKSSPRKDMDRKEEGPLDDDLGVRRFHHVEFTCSDATNTCLRFKHGLGMALASKSDQSTGNSVRLLKSSSLNFLSFLNPWRSRRLSTLHPSSCLDWKATLVQCNGSTPLKTPPICYSTTLKHTKISPIIN